MIPIRKSAVRFLNDLLSEYEVKKAKSDDSIESIGERLAAYTAGAPTKRATATSIRSLISGGTITNPTILAELEADANKLDLDADRYDSWAAALRPQLADAISFGQAFDALLPALEDINAVPAALDSFVPTVVPGSPPTNARPLKATTSSETTNHYITLWRTTQGTAFDSDKATIVETRAAAPSTLYSFSDSGAPGGSWAYYAAALNAHGLPGSVSGPINVVVA